jgi:hypothetical protein
VDNEQPDGPPLTSGVTATMSAEDELYQTSDDRTTARTMIETIAAKFSQALNLGHRQTQETVQPLTERIHALEMQLSPAPSVPETPLALLASMHQERTQGFARDSSLFGQEIPQCQAITAANTRCLKREYTVSLDGYCGTHRKLNHKLQVLEAQVARQMNIERQQLEDADPSSQMLQETSVLPTSVTATSPTCGPSGAKDTIGNQGFQQGAEMTSPTSVPTAVLEFSPTTEIHCGTEPIPTGGLGGTQVPPMSLPVPSTALQGAVPPPVLSPTTSTKRLKLPANPIPAFPNQTVNQTHAVTEWIERVILQLGLNPGFGDYMPLWVYDALSVPAKQLMTPIKQAIFQFPSSGGSTFVRRKMLPLLQQFYQPSALAQQMTARRCIQQCTVQPHETIPSFFHRLQALHYRALEVGAHIETELLTSIFWQGMLAKGSEGQFVLLATPDRSSWTSIQQTLAAYSFFPQSIHQQTQRNAAAPSVTVPSPAPICRNFQNNRCHDPRCPRRHVMTGRPLRTMPSSPSSGLPFQQQGNPMLPPPKGGSVTMPLSPPRPSPFAPRPPP